MTMEPRNWFKEQEAIDGIRMSWNRLPWSVGADPSDLIVPIGALYTPLKDVNAARIDTDPELCSNVNCKAFLNVHCSTNYDMTWTCNFCRRLNPAPALHQRLPQLHHSTVEYLHSSPNLVHSGHFFSVDHCEQGFTKAVASFPIRGRHPDDQIRTGGPEATAAELGDDDASERTDRARHIRHLRPGLSSSFWRQVLHILRPARIQKLHWITSSLPTGFERHQS